ncbi:hypothetical protein FRB90_001325 [Tulasnella sp. 427]|nr:hypothetical protein FRB90_001325 [Tulasnella sp. 427]
MAEKATPKKSAPASSTKKATEEPSVQPNAPASPPTEENTVRSVVKIAGLVITVGLSTHAAKQALHPLYGEVTASQDFDYVVAGSLALSMLLPSKPAWEGPMVDLMSVVLLLAPRTLYTWGAQTARWGNPSLGPIAAHLPVAVPILVIGGLLFSFLGADHESPSYRAMAFISTFSWIRIITSFVGNTVPQSGLNWTSCDILLACGIASSVGSVYDWFRSPASSSASANEGTSSSKLLKSPTVKFAFTALQASALFMTRSARPCSTVNYPYLSGKDGNGVRILAQKHSVTGLVQVAEELETGFRYMRCDHSLLGGVWIGEERIGSLQTTRLENLPAGGTDLEGVKLGDPIYSAFMLQDGIRLFERGPSVPAEPTALVIGLGAGIMARGFNLLNISTTIVEIDPAVHEFAYRFFNLTGHPPIATVSNDSSPFTIPPQVDQSHHMDARRYVQERAKVLNGMRPIKEELRYDYVVHDVFTGGSVPAHLFTTEMWADVKSVMRLDGILAVNFAGYLVSDASRAILTTLEESFELCRIFHDRIDAIDEGFKKDDDFINMVFFCTQSPSIELSTRDPEDRDFVNSHMKRYLFTRFEKLEIPRERIIGSEFSPVHTNREQYILKDEFNILAEVQQKTAVDHWKLMREVLPAETWEAY